MRMRLLSGMARYLLVVLAVAAAAPGMLRAESCAWLNAATASGLLGAESSVKAEPIAEHLTPAQVSARQITTPHPDADCTFVPQQAGSGAQLELAVHTMASVSSEYAGYAQVCGKASMELRAVGNQAVGCSSRKAGGVRVETIVARVRDRAFVLTWTIPNPESGANPLNGDATRERLRNVAEQVAGSLF